MSFYNTTNETGQLLIGFRQAAKSQDQLVLELYQQAGKALAASEVEAILKNKKLISVDTPITSIRRSINTLTGEMKLMKTELKHDGPLGRKEYKWTILK